MPTTLGLDLGPNSIGWALINESTKKIIATGVRVFPAGVENFDTRKERSKNEDRRLARAARRQTARRSRRKKNFKTALIEASLFPADPKQQAELYNLDPYTLRQRALCEELTPHEFGRALLHLCQRRGFLSNRKTDKDKKKETEGMLGEINQLATDMRDAEHRTLGEHLATLHHDPHERIRNRHTRRNMYMEEFDALWEAQRKYHPDLLIDKLKFGSKGKQEFPKKPEVIENGQTLLSEYGLHGLLFFQRNLKPIPKDIIGLCELEPRQRRCPRADRIAQRFRLLQEVNNLKFIDPNSRDERRLSESERVLLLDKLSERNEMTFVAIRKALGFIESIHFNLETGRRKKLLGMVTDHALAHKDRFGKKWHARPEQEKNAIVRALLEMDEKQIEELARTEWGLDESQIEKLLNLDLPAGYVHLSRKALEKLVPHLEKGLLYMADDDTPSALSEAGYLRPDQIQNRIHDSLPHPPDLANPIVRQALFEVRKVVNAVIREHGKPDQIHIELARDTKNSPERRMEITKKMRDRETQRDAAAAKLRENGINVRRESINRYLLWKEQNETCIYSGKPISFSQLFGGEIDIDHIFPYSKTLDDSMVNKVVCFRAANADKGNQTPYEWLAERETGQFEKMQQRAAHFPYNKRRRFSQKTVDLDDFIARQLVDTAYISKAVAEYVRSLFEHPHDVLCAKGQLTATLRREWGLNTVLRHDELDLKNRDDHRHHAVDAIIVALMDRPRLQKLSRSWSKEPLEHPWENFRGDVEQAVNSINVSHRVQRKISGALHEETVYGPTQKQGEFVVRKPVESLTLPMIDDIRDEQVKQIILDRLAEFDIQPGSGKAIPAEVWKYPLLMTRKQGRLSSNPSEIKKVRILKRDQTIQPIRDESTFVKPGSTHHICLFEWEDAGKKIKDAVFVTTLEAINRLKQNQPVINKVHPEQQNAKFLMSLSQNEIVLVNHNGSENLYRFITAASTSKQMWFQHQHAGGKSTDKLGVISKRPGTFEGRKLTIDPLGQIRTAND